MLLVKDVMELAKVGALTNLTVAKNDAALIKFIYLGVCELYRRFNLSIKIEAINTNPDLALYELRSKDVSLLLNVYNSNAQELRQTDVLGKDYDYKIINYRSFMVNKPKNDLLFAVYKASPEMLKSPEDEINLPDAMFDALLTYVAYMGHSTINKDNINESSAYLKRFDDACQELEMQGYKIPFSIESIDLRHKGFV